MNPKIEKLFNVLKKIVMIYFSVSISVLIILGSMFLFLSFFMTSVIMPTIYAQTNLMNCVDTQMNDWYYSMSVFQRYEYMDDYIYLDGYNYSTYAALSELKSYANDMPDDLIRENTGFLTDIVFQSFRNSTFKNACIFENINHSWRYFENGYEILNIVTPEKQTVTTNVIVTLDNAFLMGIDALMSTHTTTIKKEFEENCMLNESICDKKYLEFYELITENAQKEIIDEITSRQNVMMQAKPVNEDDERYLILNNYLYAVNDNSNWSNPVSNYSYTIFSGVVNSLVLDKTDIVKNTTRALDNFEKRAPIVKIMPLITDVLEVSAMMGLAAVKTTHVTGMTTNLKENTAVFKDVYFSQCLNDEFCTKDVFLSDDYQNCIKTYFETKNDLKDNKDEIRWVCDSDCLNDDVCNIECDELTKTIELQQNILVNYIQNCYYGEMN